MRLLTKGAQDDQASNLVATFLFGRISIWMLDTLNSATPDNMMPAESEKRTEAASSTTEARGAVFQPVIDGWAVILDLPIQKAAMAVW